MRGDVVRTPSWGRPTLLGTEAAVFRAYAEDVATLGIALLPLEELVRLLEEGAEVRATAPDGRWVSYRIEPVMER